MDHIKIPMARASILWLIGEYCDRIPKIAPDVLRKMAKTFINEVWTGATPVCDAGRGGCVMDGKAGWLFSIWSLIGVGILCRRLAGCSQAI